MFAVNGILSNHESPLRGETFVTRKITRAVAKIGLGLQDKLYLGNMNAKRDWGHAKDYVELMWMIMQLEEPEDFVIATGVTTSVRDFVRMSFNKIGVELAFAGEKEQEVGKVKACNHPEYQLPLGKEIVLVDKQYYRPTEVELLIGDASKAKARLGWKPKYDVQALCSEMVESDIELFKKDQYLKQGGYKIKQEFE